jgi:zinc transporter ZupT
MPPTTLHILAGIFALVVAASGWYYLFYSQAAGRLAGVESERTNVLRIRLRRLAGSLMILMAICFYAGIAGVNADERPGAFVLLWSGVLLLMLGIVVLALIDLRLTWKLRRSSRLPPSS